ncbi:unnamed protein product [Cuscuta epithymum]|uniref:Reticulon-like protein n=1 Tax=Cuscuta epithymum TaxID=186058 RepID=A0AAV0CQN5_9ASTE|nr:unnamed protein product [Cuscuta epithymum]
MDVGRRRDVVGGSVWESRIRHDEVKGGIKALINTSQTEEEDEESENPQEQDDQDSTFAHEEDDKVGPKPSLGRRKTWKSESFELSPIQIARRTRSHSTQSLDEERFNELSVKSPIQRSPAEKIKPRKLKLWVDNGAKQKTSESRKDFDENGKSYETIQGFEENKVAFDESRKNLKSCLGDNNENKKTGNRITRSEENCDVQEKVITSIGTLEMVKSTPKVEEDGFDEDPWEEAQENVEVSLENKVNVTEVEKPHTRNERLVSISSSTKPVSEESHRTTPKPHCRLHSYVDLVMWRDISRSALVFGFGTFVIIFSTYFKDFNTSMISALSYMGLVYLAVIFTFRSLIHRGDIQVGETSDCVVGEDEAMCAVKMLLPYINEFLLNFKALFSGDPATTMKIAVPLFVLAQCGSSITIWRMAKLGFFLVFMVPKLCSSYSSQLAAFGTLWVRRFRGYWDSCAHNKAIAICIFMVVWIFSSVIVQIWAVFMLFVAFGYYRQYWTRERQFVDEETTGARDEYSGLLGRRIANGHTKAK